MHVHGDAGVLPVDRAGVRDGVVAGVHGGGGCRVGGRLGTALPVSSGPG